MSASDGHAYAQLEDSSFFKASFQQKLNWAVCCGIICTGVCFFAEVVRDDLPLLSASDAPVTHMQSFSALNVNGLTPRHQPACQCRTIERSLGQSVQQFLFIRSRGPRCIPWNGAELGKRGATWLHARRQEDTEMEGFFQLGENSNLEYPGPDPDDFYKMMTDVEKYRAEGRLMEAANILHTLLPEMVISPGDQCFLYMDLGAIIEDIVPLPGDGPEWIVSGDPVSSPTVLLGDEELSAELCYLRATELDPENGEAHYRLADLLLRMQRPDAAHEHFELAAAAMPDDISCATHLFYNTTIEHRKNLLPVPLPDFGNMEEGNLPRGTKGVSMLTVPYDNEGWVSHAASIFEQFGALVLPKLLDSAQCKALLEAVQECDAKDTLDFTDMTRRPECRAHKALEIRSKARDGLHNTLATLWPLLSRILQSETIPLIGAGFMRVAKGAANQELHKDVDGHDRHEAIGELTRRGGSPRTVSMQIQLTDTTEERHMGSLELLPGSHRPDAPQGRPAQIESAVKDPASAVVPVNVPAGTVTLYSSRLWHRGSDNLSELERIFCFLTLMEADAPAQPGLIHTMARKDVGEWVVNKGGLKRRDGRWRGKPLPSGKGFGTTAGKRR